MPKCNGEDQNRSPTGAGSPKIQPRGSKSPYPESGHSGDLLGRLPPAGAEGNLPEVMVNSESPVLLFC